MWMTQHQDCAFRRKRMDVRFSNLSWRLSQVALLATALYAFYESSHGLPSPVSIVAVRWMTRGAP